jgi:hypothetical protein
MTKMFDRWILPESVSRASTPDRTRGCTWMTSVRQFVSGAGVPVERAALDLVAALERQGYALRRMPREDVAIWRARTCADDRGCDLAISIVDSAAPPFIEAEFLRRPSPCHVQVAAFRVTTARVLDTWVLPDHVIRSSLPDRATAGPCGWIQTVRRFLPAGGLSARSAATALVASLRERGYHIVRDANDGFLYWYADDCPDQPHCDLTIWIVDYVKHPRVEVELVRW